MRTPVPTAAAFALLAATLVAAGCAGLRGHGGDQTEHHATSTFPPDDIIRNAQSVFRFYHIPIRTVDLTTHRIESGRFEVRHHWRDLPVAERIRCETDQGQLAAARSPVDVEIRMRATERAFLIPAGIAQPDPRGASQPNTRITLRASVSVPGHYTECHLDPGFASELLAAVGGTYVPGIIAGR